MFRVLGAHHLPRGGKRSRSEGLGALVRFPRPPSQARSELFAAAAVAAACAAAPPAALAAAVTAVVSAGHDSAAHALNELLSSRLVLILHVVSLGFSKDQILNPKP